MLLCGLAAHVGLAAERTADFQGEIRPLLKTYCFGCHGDDAEENGIPQLHGFLSAAEALQAGPALWTSVADLLERGEMPPEGEPQPTAEQRQKLLAWTRALLARSGQDVSRPGPPILRRLTRLEYNNTLRDLLALDCDVFTFPERLPYKRNYYRPDQKQVADVLEVTFLEYGNKLPVLLRQSGLPGENKAEHGFTNHAAALNLSPLLMEKYLALARDVLQAPDAADRSPVLRRLLSADAASEARPRLAQFAARAFRRPVPPEDLAHYFRLYEVRREAGASQADAMRAAVAGVLTSPRFLFRIEQPPEEGALVRPLDDFELASRLSYFLWSSQPDASLLKLARQGKLGDAAVLRSEAARMLRDPRAKELSECFAVQWLQLNELFGSLPDRRRYKQFYAGPKGKRTLTLDMLTEVLLLFETILLEDRSITELIDADYAYLNPKLIELYGLEKQVADKLAAVDEWKLEKNAARGKYGKDIVWIRTPLPDRRRGGVLTTAAVLTLTSTPLRTSPVYRGAWILETVFNNPPPPPPAAVDELGEDDQPFQEAGMTLRQKLEAHRQNKACAVCHNRIDPLGFALENYDAIGRWRESYGKLPIDATGKLAGGRGYDGPVEFKQALKKRKHVFARAFIEHLLSFALNRKLEYYDAATVREIERAARAENYRFSAIVQAIVCSRTFREVGPAESNQATSEE